MYYRYIRSKYLFNRLKSNVIGKTDYNIEVRYFLCATAGVKIQTIHEEQ